MGAYENLREYHLDVMREVGNIGAGNACTALSVLLGTQIDMSVPSVHLLGFDSTSKYLGGGAHKVLGIRIDVSDDLEGMMFHIIKKRFAERIINTFYEKKLDDFDCMDEMDASVLSEMANITSGAYANSIATLTDMQINIGAPIKTKSMTVGDILKIPFESFSALSDKILIIDEQFTIGDEQITSNMILILENSSLTKLFKKLEIKE